MGNQPSGTGGSGHPGSMHTGSGGGAANGHQQAQHMGYGGAAPQSYGGAGSGGTTHPQSQSYHEESGANSSSNHAHSMQRSPSDTSMTIMDNDNLQQAVQQSGGSIEHWLDDDTVPTVFKWEHGGRQVYITGTFNGWSRQIPMHRSGNDFSYIHNLKRGKHAFKFIVDDEWRFAPDQPTVADIEGRINNFIDVTDFKAYTGEKDFEKEKAAAECSVASAVDGLDNNDATVGPADEPGTSSTSGKKADKDGEVYSHNMPDLDDYTKEPPPLPPHLRHIILNKPPQLSDTAALPVPQHVALNHLYCTAIKDNMMVLGITQRFKTKFVTTVYYSPCASK